MTKQCCSSSLGKLAHHTSLLKEGRLSGCLLDLYGLQASVNSLDCQAVPAACSPFGCYNTVLVVYSIFIGCAGYMLHLLLDLKYCISCNTPSCTLPFQDIELAAAKEQAKGFEVSWTACKAELQSAPDLSSKLAAELAVTHYHNQVRCGSQALSIGLLVCQPTLLVGTGGQ